MTLQETIKEKNLTYVGTRGNTSAKTCIVGEAPGADEERYRLPFVGASGKELGRILGEAGWPGRDLTVSYRNNIFAASDIWLTNVYRVRPPDNKLARLAEFGIPATAFIESFLAELRAYRPCIIIATGNTALGVLCPETRGKDGIARIGTYRGSLLVSNLLDWEHYVIPCHHPAFVLREWKERPVVVFCLGRAREEFEYYMQHGCLQPLPTRSLRVQPDFASLYEFLRGCIEPARRRVSVDIELGHGWPNVIGLATSPYEAMSFSLWDYDDQQLVIIWRLLNDILKNNPQIGQNYINFDCTYFEWLGLEPDMRLFESRVEDTLILHHILWPEFPHRLEFLAMQYTREPYWKSEGKKWRPKDDIRLLMKYNAKDAAVTYEVWLRLHEELEERCNAENNRKQMPILQLPV